MLDEVGLVACRALARRIEAVGVLYRLEGSRRRERKVKVKGAGCVGRRIERMRGSC